MSAERFGRLTDAPASLLLAGVRVIDPSTGADAVGDVAIVAGLLADPDAVPAGVARVDGRDLVVAPGFVDLHAHLREPGGEEAETVETGARAAARGGFTTICAMPNTDPALDDAALIRRLTARAGGAACAIRFVAAASEGRAGAAPSDVRDLVDAGAVALSDDGTAVADRLVDDTLRAVAERRIPLIEHAEDATLAGRAVMRAGATATRLGLDGWPERAELATVERDLDAVARSGGSIHFTHLSSAAVVRAVRAAKDRGLPVTADVTPHHLAMTDEWVAGSRRFAWEDVSTTDVEPSFAYDSACRVNPPLPSRDDARVLMAAVRDGTIDAIATDHAPHPAHRKLVPFGEAAPGMIGLETALSIGLAAVRAGDLELHTLLAAMSTRPAAIIGERRSLAIGTTANLVAFDPDATWRVDRSSLASRSSNTPLLGMELPGVVRLTVAGGRVTYRSGPFA